MLAVTRYPTGYSKTHTDTSIYLSKDDIICMGGSR